MASDEDWRADLENARSTGNVAKAGKGKARTGAAAARAGESEGESFSAGLSPAPAKSKGKGDAAQRRTSMERAQLATKYQKKSQLEHIMLRPDTYIGSIERVVTQMWVFEQGRMVLRNTGYVPGLYKIFDEILVNASDNKQRDASMRCIKVTVDRASGAISVWNDGRGIPVEVHAEHKVYIPELVFGHLMTGENFEDGDERVVGGRNGYGAKLANIFSSQFVVETNDSKSGQRYRQRWTDNMQHKGEPVISKASGKDFTCVTFTPDYARFGMPHGLDDDCVALMTKRVYDVAGVTDKSVKVCFNGEEIKVGGFEKYCDLYLDGAGALKKVYERINERWEVCIAPSPDGQMQQVSFVNGICTMKGGQHVQFIADQVVAKLQALLAKKHKGTEFKAHAVKAHLWVFVNCLVVNPAFDSQTKETLTTRSSKFGPPALLPKLSDKALKAVERTAVVSNVMFWAQAKEMRDLSKKAGGKKTNKIKGIDKLDDANNAGGKLSGQCTLILTEGDSAKTLAISGLSVVGRDNYGVFPLRGKLLNVRDAPANQIIKNEEIQSIMKIMGLQIGKEYGSAKELRYGHLMIMTDQDHDGSHIKGLLMNFVHHFWPSLLKVQGFLQVFITPIVKATRTGAGAGAEQTRAFYSMPEYEQWLRGLVAGEAAERKRWRIKYYKGLGTSTAKEAKEYFADLEGHRLTMRWEGEQAKDALEMAFAKSRVADRKDWLSRFVPGTHLDFAAKQISYRQFVHEELVLFSMADNARSIPSVVDGLKPSQRKVLFSCFKRNLRSDIKVAQLVGYISEHSAYHHGEVSLSSTVVNMAQNFVGSNNLNLLFPSGQFGSRIMGGKDAASARYIFTRLAPLARHVFHPLDDAVLNYLEEDGQTIEPDAFVPVIPMVLVNGASGIGTGWSTEIPCYNPRDLVRYLRRRALQCEPEHALMPWYRGFAGRIEPELTPKRGFEGRFKVTGCFHRDHEQEAVVITELPVGTWTQAYKQMLLDDKLFPEGFIKDVREGHTDTKVHFTVQLSHDAFAALADDDAALVKKFRLETTLSVANMHCFDAAGKIKRYESAEEVCEEFLAVRLALYAKRKAWIEEKLQRDYRRLDNRARFIQAVIQGEVVVTKRKKKDLLKELEAKGFEQFAKDRDPAAAKDARAAERLLQQQEDRQPGAAADEDADADGDSAAKAPADEPREVTELGKGYDYLLSMSLWTLTAEKVFELNAQRDGKRRELEAMRAKRPADLWEEDLVALEKALDEQDKIDAAEAALEAGQRHKSGKPRPKMATATVTAQPAAPIQLTALAADPWAIPGARAAPFAVKTLSAKPQHKPLRSECDNVEEAAAESPTPARKQPQQQRAKPVFRDEEQEVEILSLTERLKARMMVSPPPHPNPNHNAAGEESKKRPKASPPVLAKLGAKPRQAAAPKPKAPATDLSDDEVDEEEEEEEEWGASTPAAKPKDKRRKLKTVEKPAKAHVAPLAKAPVAKAPVAALAKAPAPRKLAPKRKVVDDSESEASTMSEEESDEGEVAVVAPRAAAATARPARAAARAPAKSNYVELSDDSEEASEEEDSSEFEASD